MRTRCRRTLATFFSAASFAALTMIAASSASLARQGQAPARPAAGKVQAAARPANAVPPKPVDDLVARRKMEELLVRWEAQSKTVTSLSVEYTRTDFSKLFGATTQFQGKARLKSPDFVYLDFYEVVDGKPNGVFSERIVCDSKNVYQFLGPPKRIFVYPQEKDAKIKSLNQGPLPFLFDMSVAKAKARYEMVFEEERKDYYLIKIIPKLAIDREEYSQALVKLRKLENGRFVPEAIRLWDPQGNDTKTFAFGKESLKENAAIANSWYDGPTMVKELSALKNPKDPKDRWIVVVNPGPGSKPQGPDGVGAKPAPKAAPPRR